ncbi:hypothetical protein [Pontibacter ruber]|uniref:Uncharacterized protein n=1 Tax=Pontibacter ruber TaxID=1343895 RepID=A0ABW5CX72_9BACT|nr:hypothetical protein [Pontibacter ruber]
MVVDYSLKKKLIKEICIPADKVIGYVINDVDLNMDGRKDVIVRYHKMPLADGDIITHDIYIKIDDSNYKLIKSLDNLKSPVLKSYDPDYVKTNPLTQDISSRFPRNVEVEFKDNLITISHFLYDVYGKTYSFEYRKSANDWVLSKEEYWIGDLAPNYIALMGVSEKLRGKVVLEEKKQVKPVKIADFSLEESKKKAEEEGEYLMENYDIFNWKVE